MPIEIKTCIYFNKIWIPIEDIEGVSTKIDSYIYEDTSWYSITIAIKNSPYVYTEHYTNKTKVENRLKDLLRIFKPIGD